MGAKFLCCLPLRLGVIVIAFIQFLITGAVGGSVWWVFYHEERNEQSQISSGLRIGIIVMGTIYTLTAILSLVGFLGALFKKLRFIKTYLFVIVCALGLQIASAVFTLILYYRHKNSPTDECIIKGNFTVGNVDVCQGWDKVPQAAFIIACIVPILIQAYALYIVAAYKKRLSMQDAARLSLAVGPASSPYQPVQATDESYSLMHPNMKYPYADAPHSFGSPTYPIPRNGEKRYEQPPEGIDRV